MAFTSSPIARQTAFASHRFQSKKAKEVSASIRRRHPGVKSTAGQLLKPAALHEKIDLAGTHFTFALKKGSVFAGGAFRDAQTIAEL